MKTRVAVILFALVILVAAVEAQMTPWYQWTFLDAEIMDEIVGEASGETAWNSMLEMGAYNRDRLAPEYAGTFLETQYVIGELRRYGVAGSEVTLFPGGQVWDGEKGEL